MRVRLADAPTGQVALLVVGAVAVGRAVVDVDATAVVTDHHLVASVLVEDDLVTRLVSTLDGNPHFVTSSRGFEVARIQRPGRGGWGYGPGPGPTGRPGGGGPGGPGLG